MEISTSVNSSQSLALAAYTAQQEQREVSRSREQERRPESSETSQPPAAKRGDNVSFSSEALQLSSQSGQNNTAGKVNQASESEASNARRQQQQQTVTPEVRRAESAQSVAQAINAYRTTSII